jgi:hypothetical protein
MFYICGAWGFYTYPHKKADAKYQPDIRLAVPYPTFRAADDFARSLFGDNYYAVCNMGYRPDPVSLTLHHFDIGQQVKVVRGPEGEVAPAEYQLSKPLKGKIGVVRDVSLVDNVFMYRVAIEVDGHLIPLGFSAKVLTPACRNDDAKL